MNKQHTITQTKRTVRNLSIFTLVTLGGGWLGLWLDRQMGIGPGEQGLGTLLWLISPAAAGLLLRAFGGDGWNQAGIRPRFRNNLRWYSLSILIYPAVILFILMIGKAAGAFSLIPNTWSLFVPVFVAALIPNFIKNIFEEFAWRGYLDPELSNLPIHDFVGYALTGLVWTSWHLPYWFGFLERSVVESYSPYNMTGFVLISIPALISASIVFGELRRITDSVWPTVLLHTIGNALLLPLILDGFVTMNGNLAFLFTPGMEGIVMMLLFVGVGIALRRFRLNTQSKTETKISSLEPLHVT